MSSYFHSASQNCALLSENWTFRHILHLLLFSGDRSGMNKSSSATYLLYSDVLKGEVPRDQGKIRKRTKKKPWKGLSSSRRFSFHNFYNFFFFFFKLYFIIFFYTLFTHYVYPHPRPTTFSYTRSRLTDLISKKTNCTCSTRFLLISKKQICTCSTLFCLSLAVVLHDYNAVLYV